MQDSVLNSINANICLLALVPAEVCHFAAQAAFLCYLFIFFVEKNSVQLIFVLGKFSWVCVQALSCNNSNFVCFEKWHFRFLCDLFIPHMEEQCCLAVSGVETYANPMMVLVIQNVLHMHSEFFIPEKKGNPHSLK